MFMDVEKSNAFDCLKCTPQMQKVRNCFGKFEKNPIMVNKDVYVECPRGLTIQHSRYQSVVEIFFDCRRKNIFPVSGGSLEQTAFTIQAFDYLESLVCIYMERNKPKTTKQKQKNLAKFNR